MQKKLSGHPNIVQFCSAASIGKEESDTGQAEFLLLTELCKGKVPWSLSAFWCVWTVVKYSQYVVKMHCSCLKEPASYPLILVLVGKCICVSVDYRFLFVCSFVCFETVSWCRSGCPGTCYVDQTSVEIADTYIPLPAGIKGVQPCLALGCRFWRAWSHHIFLLKQDE